MSASPISCCKLADVKAIEVLQWKFPFETDLKHKSRETSFVHNTHATYPIQLRGVQQYPCRALFEISKGLGNWKGS